MENETTVNYAFALKHRQHDRYSQERIEDESLHIEEHICFQRFLWQSIAKHNPLSIKLLQKVRAAKGEHASNVRS